MPFWFLDPCYGNNMKHPVFLTVTNCSFHWLTTFSGCWSKTFLSVSTTSQVRFFHSFGMAKWKCCMVCHHFPIISHHFPSFSHHFSSNRLTFAWTLALLSCEAGCQVPVPPLVPSVDDPNWLFVKQQFFLDRLKSPVSIVPVWCMCDVCIYIVYMYMYIVFIYIYILYMQYILYTVDGRNLGQLIGGLSCVL